jgi:hypothetical protein
MGVVRIVPPESTAEGVGAWIAHVERRERVREIGNDLQARRDEFVRDGIPVALRERLVQDAHRERNAQLVAAIARAVRRLTPRFR